MGNEQGRGQRGKLISVCLYVFRDLLNLNEADFQLLREREAEVGKHALQSAMFIQNG